MAVEDYHLLGPDIVTKLGRRFGSQSVGGPLDGATYEQLEFIQYLKQRGVVTAPRLRVSEEGVKAILASAEPVDFSQIKADPKINPLRVELLRDLAKAAIKASDGLIRANGLETSHGPHHFYSKTHAISVGGNTRGFDPEMVADARALEHTAQTGLSYGQLRGKPGQDHRLALKIQLHPLSTYSLRRKAGVEVTDVELIAELVRGYLKITLDLFPRGRTYFDYQYMTQPGYTKPGVAPITGFVAILNPSKVFRPGPKQLVFG